MSAIIFIFCLFYICETSPVEQQKKISSPPANALPLIISPQFGNILIPGTNINNGYITNKKDLNIGSYYVPFEKNQTRNSVGAQSKNSLLIQMDTSTLLQNAKTPSKIALNKDRIYCKLHTPLPDCSIRNAENMYGKWFVQTQPGLEKGSPICEKVEFFPGNTQHNFQKILRTFIQNGTWVTQHQNGTIISPGKLMLEMELVNGVPTNPRKVATYTLIDADPDNYITAFYCKSGQPSIPVLTRAEVPSMAVWARVFAGVLKAGLNLSWMDLNCRPPALNTEPIPNARDIPIELPLRSTANSIMF